MRSAMCINIGMARPKRDIKPIRIWLIHAIEQPHLATIASETFGISRHTVNRILNDLIKEGLIESEGRTQARTYKLRVLASVRQKMPVTSDLKEDVVWRQLLVPHFAEVRPNVRDICQFGFTEMFSNVVAHSGATE